MCLCVCVCVCVCVYVLSHVQIFPAPMDYSPPGSLSMEFSRQEYWCHFLSRGFSQPRDQTCLFHLLHWQVYSLPLAPPGILFGNKRNNVPILATTRMHLENSMLSERSQSQKTTHCVRPHIQNVQNKLI